MSEPVEKVEVEIVDDPAAEAAKVLQDGFHAAGASLLLRAALMVVLGLLLVVNPGGSLLMLTRGIGVNKNVNGDVFVIDIYTDDIILLCSDGLTDMLHDKEITGYLQMEDTEASADALLSASLEKGGKDNISFIILKLDRKEVEHDGR